MPLTMPASRQTATEQDRVAVRQAFHLCGQWPRRLGQRLIIVLPHSHLLVIANLTTQYNAIKMLSDRIQMLVKYTDDVRAGTVPRDHESLRQIASLVARLPASGDIAEFRQEFLTEHNDLLLTIYLSDMTNGVHGLNEVRTARECERDLSPMVAALIVTAELTH